MAIPRYLTAAAIPQDVAVPLPAVASMTAGGFLVASAPLARFGAPKDAMTFILLSYEQRCALERDNPKLGDAFPFLTPDFVRLALFSAGGGKAPWSSAANLWVAVPWLLALLPAAEAPSTHGGRLVAALVRQAAAAK